MYLVIDNNFKPLSFDDLYKPYGKYIESYEKNLDKQEKLLEASSKLGTLIDQYRDPVQYAQLQDYKNRLLSYADAMANGQTRRVVRDINQARLDYAGTFKPLEELARKREELAKEQRLLRAQGKRGVYFDKDYGTMSLSDMAKSSSTYNTVKGEDLYTAALGFANSESGRHFIHTMQKATGDLKGYFFENMQRRGYTSEELQQLINTANKNSEFVKAKDRILEEFGVSQLNKEDQNKALQNIISGFLDNTAYAQSISYSEDPTFSRSMQSAQLALSRAQFEQNQPQSWLLDLSTVTPSPNTFVSNIAARNGTDMNNIYFKKPTGRVTANGDDEYKYYMRMYGPKNNIMQSYYFDTAKGVLYPLLMPQTKETNNNGNKDNSGRTQKGKDLEGVS